MASENKTENVMLTGQTAYFKKSGAMVNRGTLDLPNALVSRNYAEGYIGPNSIIHGTDLAETTEYLQCESTMKSYLGSNWKTVEGERSIITNSGVIKDLLLPHEEYFQETADSIGFNGTEYQYIRSSGTQYIDTEIAGNKVYGLEFSFVPYGTSSYDYESWLSGTLDDFTLGEQNTTYSQCYLRWRGTEIFNSVTLITGSANVNVLKIKDNKITIRNNSYTVDTSLPVSKSTSTIKLFNNSSLSRYGACYFKGLKLYGQDGTLLADIQPVRDANSVICVYDFARKKYLYNKGTGTFSAGSVKYRNYVPLEYIENVGTGYIHLDGKRGVPNSGFYLDFMPTNESGAVEPTGEKAIISCGGLGYDNGSTICYPQINICYKPDFPNGSVMQGRDTTPIDAKLIQYSRVQIELKNNILTLSDGSTYSMTPVTSVPSYNYWRLFRPYSMGTITHEFGKGRIYACKIYEGDEVVLDLIPAKNLANNLACLYDKVSDKIIATAGTAFKLGPEIEIED